MQWSTSFQPLHWPCKYSPRTHPRDLDNSAWESLRKRERIAMCKPLGFELSLPGKGPILRGGQTWLEERVVPSRRPWTMSELSTLRLKCKIKPCRASSLDNKMGKQIWHLQTLESQVTWYILYKHCHYTGNKCCYHMRCWGTLSKLLMMWPCWKQVALHHGFSDAGSSASDLRLPFLCSLLTRPLNVGAAL